MQSDPRSHKPIPVPESGWGFTGEPVPSPPLHAVDVEGQKLWAYLFSLPVSYLWTDADLIAANRLCALQDMFCEDPKHVTSAEMRNLEATLAIPVKVRREFRLVILADDQFAAFLASGQSFDPDTDYVEEAESRDTVVLDQKLSDRRQRLLADA